jgi:hypothetical protein
VAPARALRARLVEALESSLAGADLDVLSERLGQVAATLGGSVGTPPRAGA